MARKEIYVNVDLGGEPDFEEGRGFVAATITKRGELRICLFDVWMSNKLPLVNLSIVYEEG